MKKLVLLAAVVGGAFAANASYLLWQVNSADVAGGTPSYLGDGRINAAVVYQVAADADAIAAFNSNKDNPIDGATAITSHLYNNNTIDTSSTGGAVGIMPSGVSFYADLGDISAGSQYAYYIELVNYNTTTHETYVHARSDAVSYADLAGNITSDLSVVTIANVTPWHGANYTAVPEPTSALMMLLGAAMLGLRRKKGSVA